MPEQEAVAERELEPAVEAALDAGSLWGLLTLELAAWAPWLLVVFRSSCPRQRRSHFFFQLVVCYLG